jgi:Uma2 family endonuclease
MAMPDTRPFPRPRSGRTVWTVADLERLPDDGNRYEILHGELLVTPMPSTEHQRIAMRLSVLTVLWCRAHTGWTVLAPGGVYVSETTWMEPDLAVYAAPESADLSWREMPPPLLVVEILSRSTTRRDRHRKRPAYLAHGVAEVWTIDAPRRTIERWTRASEFPETHRDGITWAPDATLPPLVATADELFGPRPEERADR